MNFNHPTRPSCSIHCAGRLYQRALSAIAILSLIVPFLHPFVYLSLYYAFIRPSIRLSACPFDLPFLRILFIISLRLYFPSWSSQLLPYTVLCTRYIQCWLTHGVVWVQCRVNWEPRPIPYMSVCWFSMFKFNYLWATNFPFDTYNRLIKLHCIELH